MSIRIFARIYMKQLWKITIVHKFEKYINDN